MRTSKYLSGPKRKRSSGINAVAWFYSQSFHSSAQEAPANDKDPDAVSQEECPTCGNPRTDPKEVRIGLNEFKSCEDIFHSSGRTAIAKAVRA